MVSDLIIDEPRRWNIELVNHLFWPADRQVILNIPLGMSNSTDVLMWHYDKKGLYSVKSGYKAIMNK